MRDFVLGYRLDVSCGIGSYVGHRLNITTLAFIMI
jgi:hypothetical protein